MMWWNFHWIHAGLLWGLATLGFRERKFFTRAAECAEQCIDDMTTVDMFTTLWAFARCGRAANQFVMQAFHRLPQEMSHLKPHQLVSLAWALGKVGNYNRPVMEALANAAEKYAPELDVKVNLTLNFDAILEGS